jgi:transcriptional regulator with PAS, ATPase and Fis domain
MDRDVYDAKVTLAHVLAHTADGVFVLDSSYRCVLFTPACERITGYSASEVLGTDFRREEGGSRPGPPDRPPLHTLCPDWRPLRDEPDTLRKQLRIRRQDGATVWVEGQYTVLRDEGGQLKGVIGILRVRSTAAVNEERLRAPPAALPPDDLPDLLRGETLKTDETGAALDQPLDDVLASVERRAILTALRRTQGQRSRAAREMGISRSRLYRRMEALGIHPRDEL